MLVDPTVMGGSDVLPQSGLTHSFIFQDNGLRWMMVLVDTRQQGESIYLGEQVDTVLFYTKGWQGMHIKGEGTSSR